MAEEDRPAQKGQSPRDERDEDDAARRAGGTGQGPTEIQPGTHECHDPCVAGGVAGDRERRAVRPRPGTDEDPAGNDQGAGPCPGPDAPSHEPCSLSTNGQHKPTERPNAV